MKFDVLSKRRPWAYRAKQSQKAVAGSQQPVGGCKNEPNSLESDVQNEPNSWSAGHRGAHPIVRNEANFRPGPTRRIWNPPPYAGHTRSRSKEEPNRANGRII